MKHEVIFLKTKLLLGIALFILLGLEISGSGMGMTPQWVPQSGTTLNYALSWSLTYENGTRLASTTFDVYKENVMPPTYFFLPATLDPGFVFGNYTGYSLLEQGIPIMLTRNYVSLNSTTLNRTASMTFGSLTLTAPATIVGFPWWIRSGSDEQYVTINSDVVQKDGYPATDGMLFIDYFNNALQPGDSFLSPVNLAYTIANYSSSVLSKSSTEIVAFWSDALTGVNGTYVADPSGQVRTYTWASSFTFFWPYIRGYSFTYTRVGGTPAISSPGTITYRQGTTGHSISWTITDSSTGTATYQVLTNGTLASSGSWTSGVPVTISVDGLSPGSYNYTIAVDDGLGGSARSTAWIVVIPGPSSTIEGFPAAIVALFSLLGIAVAVTFARRSRPARIAQA